MWNIFRGPSGDALGLLSSRIRSRAWCVCLPYLTGGMPKGAQDPVTKRERKGLLLLEDILAT